MTPKPTAVRKQAGGLLLAALAFCLTGCSPQPPGVAELSGRTMGTTYSIKVTPPPDDASAQRLRHRVERRLAEINLLMSTYRDDSVLSRFNAHRGTNWVAVPAELVSLVRQARTISERTAGAYDVTVGPLVNLWGFGRNGRRDSPPGDDEIEALLASTGYDRLETRHQPPAIRKAAVVSRSTCLRSQRAGVSTNWRTCSNARVSATTWSRSAVN